LSEDFRVVVNIGIAVAGAALILRSLLSWRWRRTQARSAEHWPTTNATIESSSLEVVAHTRYGSIQLPVFAFSYRVGSDYFSGRFALRPYATDPGAAVVERLIGSKLQVQYDPSHAEKWFIADKLIEGCRVEQELSPDLLNLKPRD
jgi:hypothetical protein